MGGSQKRDREAKRESARTDQISMVARLALVVWEIIWTLLREHIFMAGYRRLG
jgi:hypothetical protein